MSNDSAAPGRVFSRQDFRKWAKEFVHFQFITVDGKVTLDDYGINVIDSMPEDLTAADNNVELRVCSDMAVLDRARDKYDANIDTLKDDLEQAEDNLARQLASITRTILADPSITWKKTDASLAAHAGADDTVIDLREKISNIKAQLREAREERRYAESGVIALQRYHKALDIHVRRMAIGMYHADLPRPRLPENIAIPVISKKELLEEEDDDPRAGFSTWKK